MVFLFKNKFSGVTLAVAVTSPIYFQAELPGYTRPVHGY